MNFVSNNDEFCTTNAEFNRSFKAFTWSFTKDTFPRMQDGGEAEAQVQSRLFAVQKGWILQFKKDGFCIQDEDFCF